MSIWKNEILKSQPHKNTIYHNHKGKKCENVHFYLIPFLQEYLNLCYSCVINFKQGKVK